MNEPNAKEAELIIFDKIEAKIYGLRGQGVMLDSDLAEIYGTETKVLKQAVRRNLNRFPADFMFELTLEEMRQTELLRSQIVTLETKAKTSNRGRQSKYTSICFFGTRRSDAGDHFEQPNSDQSQFAGCAGFCSSANDFARTSRLHVDNLIETILVGSPLMNKKCANHNAPATNNCFARGAIRLL